jgi:hypothetical protein
MGLSPGKRRVLQIYLQHPNSPATFGKLSARIQVPLLRRLEVLRINGQHLN